jgi:N-acetylglucosamine malate deacetylase 1
MFHRPRESLNRIEMRDVQQVIPRLDARSSKMHRPPFLDGILEHTATRFLRRIHRITHRMPVKLGPIEKRRVLVVAPHPDDEVIAIGGNLALHKRLGSEVLTLFVTLDTVARKAEAERVARLIGFDYRFLAFPDGSVSLHEPTVSRLIANAIRSFRPEVIYCPFPGDHHRDHQSTSACTAAAVAETCYAGQVWCYELWSCLWPNIGVDISSVVDIKRDAIKCYASQVAYVDYVEGALGLNRFRGLKLGVAYAEALFTSGPRTFINVSRTLAVV